MASPARPMVLFVLGMGRSGTSALTRVLSLCGGALPGALLGANAGNPLGHWEPRKALELNDGFLSRYGASWYDPTLRLQAEITYGEEEKAAYLEQIEEFLRSLPAAPFLVLKEPRITALFDFWLQATIRLGLSIGIVIPVRHPEEVAASLTARDRVSPELAAALWLKYNLLAERRSRLFPRVFVRYANLLRDWRAEVDRIGAALSADLSVRDGAAIDGFLRKDLRRHQHSGGICEIFGAEWLSQVYAALCAAARDQPMDLGTMDAAFETYRACERGFRIALADFHGRLLPAERARQPASVR